jgi:hypothetical protein
LSRSHSAVGGTLCSRRKASERSRQTCWTHRRLRSSRRSSSVSRCGFGSTRWLLGQAPGMLLELRRVEQISGAPTLSDRDLASGMQDEDRGRGLAAFEQGGHRNPQSFNRRLENQDGFPGHKPARVTPEQCPLDSKAGPPDPSHAEQDPDDSTPHGRPSGRDPLCESRHPGACSPRRCGGNPSSAISRGLRELPRVLRSTQ